VLHESISRQPELTGFENEAQMNEIYLQEGIQIIKAYPLRYLALSAYRFTMLWFNWRVNEVYGKPDTAGDHLMVLQNLFLLVGGMIGLRGRFSGLYMAVMAHLPYIIPVVPGLVVLTAIALTQLATLVVRMFAQSARAIHV
jgi:hypothetical protein